jgi:hypothetical protein
MLNGPFCGPLGTRIQSKLLYTKLEGARQKPETNIKPVFFDQRLHYEETVGKIVAKEKAWKRKSDDAGVGDSGIFLVDKQYWFMLKFFTYDFVVQGDHDYPIEKAFQKVYSTTEDLLIMFPN